LDFVGSFFQELITLAGYALIFAGVYKLYQIGTDIREIKEALKSAQRVQASFNPPLQANAGTDSDTSFETANSYAQSLLRAVQAQGEAHSGEPVEAERPRS
jgi:hypothetical protein